MKIKEIRVYGFKSFCEESRIILNTGVTAFVGPNGSGKSNIFDALRWVFGEQSMKALRCERIEDLIHTSPDAKNNVRFTEVAVIIENEDYFPQFGSEFEIKRRFYRDGESEFFLNRVKCRLQDIQALFLNSGTLTYSFLELAEIEKIIRGDTKEMFDDVSGILRYRERREQTKRRLEATEQDLLRLEDIIAEMQRSLRSLKRQVRQARLYQELRDEYKELSLFILQKEYGETQKEAALVKNEKVKLEQTVQTINQEIKNLENERTRMKNSLAEIQEKKKRHQDYLNQLDEEIEKLSNILKEKEKRVREITLFRERQATSIKEKKSYLDSESARLNNLQQEIKEVEKKIEEFNKLINSEKEAIESLNQKYFSKKEVLRDKTTKRSGILKELGNLKNELSRFNLEIENKNAALSHINEEYIKEKEELDRNLRTQQEIKEELHKIIVEQNQLSQQLDEITERLQKTEENLAEVQNGLSEREQEKNNCKILIDTLQHRILLPDEKKLKSQFEKRILGLFRESINVASNYEAIVDICLGDILNFYLLTDFQEDDFERLPEGRYGFIRLKSPALESAVDEIEGARSIIEFIKFKNNKERLFHYIKDYYLVKDIDAADSLSLRYPDYGFVAPGPILFRRGVVIVEKGEMGYFRITQRLEEQRRKLESLKNEIIFLTQEKERLEKELDAAKKEIEEKKEKLFSFNIKKSEYSLRKSEIERAIERNNKELNGLKNEISELNSELEGLKTHSQQNEKRIDGYEKELNLVNEGIDEISKELDSLRTEIDKKNQYLNELTTETAILIERRDNLARTINQVQHGIQTIRAEIEQLDRFQDTQELQELNNTIAALEQELNNKKKQRLEYELELSDEKLRSYTQQQEMLYDQLTRKQKQYEEVNNQLLELKYRLFQLQHRQEEYIKKAREEFDVELKEYIAEQTFEDPGERLGVIKGKLERLGEINPLALQVYENEKKRLDDFLNQRNDIIAAKKHLIKTIEELDQRARERFITVFEQVKKEFNFVFANFFEGGQADLILTNPENTLQSKIQIVVRMRGKKLKTINQLSGGERTLLAISLLLAFYLVKPAPFCILDEIDAPLDDANVVRFNKFLRDLSQRTQVIIITHNRATMEYADYLYGLTMEKPGQSKIISARLADLEKIGAVE